MSSLAFMERHYPDLFQVTPVMCRISFPDGHILTFRYSRQRLWDALLQIRHQVKPGMKGSIEIYQGGA